MRSRGLALISLAVLTALLAACSPLPGVFAPTAAPFTATAPAIEPAASPTVAAPAVEPAATTAGESTSPLPTAEIQPEKAAPITPTVSAPITPTAGITGTTSGAPAIAEGPPITGTMQVSPTISGASGLAAAPVPELATYQDEAGGFAMDYPASWSVVDVTSDVKQKSLGYSITLMSWKPEEPGTGGIPQGGSKIDVSVTKKAGLSLDAAVESRRQELAAIDAAAKITGEETWTLPGGLTGVHWTVQPGQGDTVQELVTAINGNRILVSGLGDMSLFQQIATTVRPLSLLNPNAPLTESGAGQSLATPTPELNNQLSVPLVTSGSEAAQTQASRPTVYIVRQGDTLAKIAARFGFTVAALRKANPQITNPDKIYIGQRITIPGGGAPQPTPGGTTQVNIYMMGIGGGSVGCGDQVVPVRRDIPNTNAPLTEALKLLLSQKNQYYGESGLYNALYQSNLSVANITRSGSDWTVSLVGTLKLGGVCDNPRVKAQLEQTALQFPTVKSVRYLINGKPLDTVLSGK